VRRALAGLLMRLAQWLEREPPVSIVPDETMEADPLEDAPAHWRALIKPGARRVQLRIVADPPPSHTANAGGAALDEPAATRELPPPQAAPSDWRQVVRERARKLSGSPSSGTTHAVTPAPHSDEPREHERARKGLENLTASDFVEPEQADAAPSAAVPRVTGTLRSKRLGINAGKIAKHNDVSNPREREAWIRPEGESTSTLNAESGESVADFAREHDVETLRPEGRLAPKPRRADHEAARRAPTKWNERGELSERSDTSPSPTDHRASPTLSTRGDRVSGEASARVFAPGPPSRPAIEGDGIERRSGSRETAAPSTNSQNPQDLQKLQDPQNAQDPLALQGARVFRFPAELPTQTARGYNQEDNTVPLWPSLLDETDSGVVDPAENIWPSFTHHAERSNDARIDEAAMERALRTASLLAEQRGERWNA